MIAVNKVDPATYNNTTIWFIIGPTYMLMTRGRTAMPDVYCEAYVLWY